jgi:hypothetical protein
MTPESEHDDEDPEEPRVLHKIAWACVLVAAALLVTVIYAATR